MEESGNVGSEILSKELKNTSIVELGLRDVVGELI